MADKNKSYGIDVEKAVAAINSKLTSNGRKVEKIDEVSPGQYEITVVGSNAGKDLAVLDKHRALKEKASTLYREALTRSTLDLSPTSVMSAKPQDLIQRAISTYFEKDYYGSVIDALVNFSSAGFRNDCDDKDVKYFYDSWCFDIKFNNILWQIFHDFFRVGMVRTFRVLSKYVPRIGTTPTQPNSISLNPASDLEAAKMYGAKKNIWSKAFIPVRYTVLNPTSYEIPSTALFIDVPKVLLKGKNLKTLKAIIDKKSSDLSDEEKNILKTLPKEIRDAASTGKDVLLGEKYINAVDYRRMSYEQYAKPKGAKAFDSLAFKEELIKADYSTLDGATSYILVITVGTDEFPVTDQATLEKVSDLFDTASKSFDVTWNHTLQVKKITTPELAQILGENKYIPVNKDISSALSFTRAIIDGTVQVNQATADAAIKNVIQEVNYARQQVRDWVYTEYRLIAEAMGFTVFPSVRWDNYVLRDDILVKKLLQGFADRRIISYKTIIDELGYSFENELSQMTEERSLVVSGVLGILGSPYQQGGGALYDVPSKEQPSDTESQPSPEEDQPSKVQKTQRTPKGTPSEGRPVGQTNKKAKKGQSSEDPLEEVLGSKEAADLIFDLVEKVSSSRGKEKQQLLESLTKLTREQD